MRAGVFQPAAGGGAERISRLEAAIAGQGLDLVLCPELFLTGYDIGERIRADAEPSDGPAARRIADMARRTGTAVVYGYAELEGTHLYNSLACIGGTGELLANHRKTVLPPGFESSFFATGTGPLPLFEVAGVRCAAMICYEAEFPEGVRGAAEACAEVVLVPTALSDQWHSVAFRMIPTRAFENGVWLLYANHSGAEGSIRYLGASCIVAPDGSDAARAGDGAEIIAAQIDLAGYDATRARLPYLADLPVLRRNLLS